MLYLGPNINVLLPPHWPGTSSFPHIWTPGIPSLLIGQLPVDREIVYLSRYGASESAGGYTLTDTSGPPLSGNFDAALAAEYTGTVVDHEGPFVLTRYRQKGVPPPS